MSDLQQRMAASVESDFDDLVDHCTRSVEVVAYFLALLELARWGIVALSQDSIQDTIRVRYDAAAGVPTMQGDA